MKLTSFIAFAMSGYTRKIARSLSLKMTMTSRSPHVQRSFRFVPYGASAPASEIPTITCDGRVPGATLEVTHWIGNDTPDQLYADTSTEMALKLAKLHDDFEEFKAATVLNNHFDTDGVCSVWACLEPDEALKYENLLIEAAEAGDFGEWSSNRGVKLDCAILSFCSSEDDDEAVAYERVLQEMPVLLQSIMVDDNRNIKGNSYEKLWQDGFQEAFAGWKDLEQGRAKLRRAAASKDIVILEEATHASFLSPYALHRGLKEYGLWDGTTRILRVNAFSDGDEDSTGFTYNYEKIGHGWVKKLVTRHLVPDVNRDELVRNLNKESPGLSSWKTGGPSGLVAICQSRQTMPPDDVASLLARFDEGCT